MTAQAVNKKQTKKAVKPKEHTGNYTKKRLAQFKMLDAGVSTADALKISNNKDIISSTAKDNLKKAYRKYLLTSPSIVRKAHSVIKDALEGVEHRYTAQKVTPKGDVVDYNEVIAPSYANRLAAAAMVYDRYDPVKGNAGEGGDKVIHPVNLALFVNVQSGTQEPKMMGEVGDTTEAILIDTSKNG